MGGIGDFLFGKKSKGGESESGNYAWDVLKPALSPALGYLTGGGNMMGSLLGIPGMGNQTDALNNYAKSGGMDFLMQQGQKAITSSKAASGLLKSGSYGTALAKYGTGLASTYLNDYMKNLMGFSQLGLGAAGALSGAGGWSKGVGATQGKQGALPSLISAAASIPGISDIRLKSNVVKIGELPNGLGIYEYDLDEGWGGGRHRGVVAHEVKRIQPAAYLPNYFGKYHGVDYGKIKGLY